MGSWIDSSPHKRYTPNHKDPWFVFLMNWRYVGQLHFVLPPGERPKQSLYCEHYVFKRPGPGEPIYENLRSCSRKGTHIFVCPLENVHVTHLCWQHYRGQLQANVNYVDTGTLAYPTSI